MSFTMLLFSRIAFLRVECLSDGTHSRCVFLWHRSAGLVDMPPEEHAGMLKKWLVVAVVCGQGVVVKADDAPLVERVRTDTETFCWNSVDGMTAFMRRTQMRQLTDELASAGIWPVRAVCADAGTDFRKLADAFAAELYSSFRWKELVYLTERASAAAFVAARRLVFPIAGFLFIILSVNMLLTMQLNTRRQILQTAFEFYRRTASETTAADERQRHLLAEFATCSAVSYALLCDRIGQVVPEGVTLTRLEVEPLQKRFEAGKPLQRLEGEAVVSGEALSTGDVSRFSELLAEQSECREVRLTRIGKERRGDKLSFIIVIGL